MKEPFDLFKTQSELAQVTNLARAAVHDRQASVAFILRFIPWISALGCAIGALLIYFGLKRWYSNQLLLDEQAKIEVELKKQSLRDATKDEIARAAAQELSTMSVQEPSEDEYKLHVFEDQYAQLEGAVAGRLRALYSSKYDVEQNKMIGGVELDILRRGKARLTKDVIVEVKAIRRGFNYGWLREVFLKNVYAKNIYAQLTNRLPNTLLLIVLDLRSEAPDKYRTLLERLSQEGLGRAGKDRAVIVTKDDLTSLSDEALRERIGMYA